MKTKSIIMVIVILLILAIASIIFLKIYFPKYNNYNQYPLRGEVVLKSNIGDRPSYVAIYYPYFQIDNLCQGEEIDITRIDWINDSYGKFDILITVPIGLKKVILTTNCDKCNHQEIYLDNIQNSINLIYDGSKCENKEDVGNAPTQVIEIARNVLNRVDEEKSSKIFNNSEFEDLNQDIERGRSYISESDRDLSYDNKLRDAYFSEWLAWRSSYKQGFLDLKYCLIEVEDNFKKKDKCYSPDYNSYLDYLSVNRTYYSDLNGYILKREPFEIKNNNTLLKQEVLWAKQDWVRIYNEKEKCTKTRDIIDATFDYQKPYCSIRNVVDIGIIVNTAIIFTLLGILYMTIKLQWKKIK